MSNLRSKQQLIAFIEENQERFYRIAFSYVKNSEDALDVVHNAIVKALQNQQTLRTPQYAETWFYRILINESISYLRQRRRTVSLHAFAAEEIPDPDPGGSEYIDLYRAIDRLPGRLKTVLLLRYFEDMKLEQIAAITGVNLSTTKSRLYKALKILKIDLEVIDHD